MEKKDMLERAKKYIEASEKNNRFIEEWKHEFERAIKNNEHPTTIKEKFYRKSQELWKELEEAKKAFYEIFLQSGD